jgi:hypothetical protein
MDPDPGGEKNFRIRIRNTRQEPSPPQRLFIMHTVVFSLCMYITKMAEITVGGCKAEG